MIKNIVSWFAMLVLAGVLTACGQSQDNGQESGKAAPEAPSSAPADGGQPSQPPAGQ